VSQRSVTDDIGTEWTIPRFERPPITGREAAPNRRGAELAGLGGGTADDLLTGDAAAGLEVLIVCDSDFGQGAYSAETVARLRQAKFLVVFGWADSPLAQAADVALPVPHHGEKDGTFVNVEWRLQRFERAFAAPGQARSTVEALGDLLSRFDAAWANQSPGKVFDRLAGELAPFAGLHWHGLPATGATLKVPGAPHRMPDAAVETSSEASS
jgi:predicted molibdopterin-dependent oxidoreductase YjgC